MKQHNITRSVSKKEKLMAYIQTAMESGLWTWFVTDRATIPYIVLQCEDCSMRLNLANPELLDLFSMNVRQSKSDMVTLLRIQKLEALGL